MLLRLLHPLVLPLACALKDERTWRLFMRSLHSFLPLLHLRCGCLVNTQGKIQQESRFRWTCVRDVCVCPLSISPILCPRELRRIPCTLCTPSPNIKSIPNCTSAATFQRPLPTPYGACFYNVTLYRRGEKGAPTSVIYGLVVSFWPDPLSNAQSK